MAEAQENSAKLDGSVPLDQVMGRVKDAILDEEFTSFLQRAKVTEKVDRFRKEKESIKVKYMEALQELNRANPKYMDDMNEVTTHRDVIDDRLRRKSFPGLFPVPNVWKGSFGEVSRILHGDGKMRGSLSSITVSRLSSFHRRQEQKISLENVPFYRIINNSSRRFANRSRESLFLIVSSAFDFFSSLETLRFSSCLVMSRGKSDFLVQLRWLMKKCQRSLRKGQENSFHHHDKVLCANVENIVISCHFRSANFQQFSQVIKNCDADKDLAWWSDTYGAGMKMNWPTFEVCSSTDECSSSFQTYRPSRSFSNCSFRRFCHPLGTNTFNLLCRFQPIETLFLSFARVFHQPWRLASSTVGWFCQSNQRSHGLWHPHLSCGFLRNPSSIRCDVPQPSSHVFAVT